MINGVRVRDSGVELSPTGTDRRGARERHPTARFELLRQSRPDRRGGSCGGPNGHFRPVWRNGQCWRPLRYIKIFFISVAGQLATRPLTASHVLLGGHGEKEARL